MRFVGDLLELHGRDGPTFVDPTDIRRVLGKENGTLIVFGAGKLEFVLDEAQAIVDFLAARNGRKLREIE